MDMIFMPHGHCFYFTPWILWPWVIGNAVVLAAYVWIPFTLLSIARERPDMRFKAMYVLFSAFIFLCGLTHAVSIWTVWKADYTAANVVVIATAVVSLWTAMILWSKRHEMARFATTKQVQELVKRIDEEVEPQMTSQAAIAALREVVKDMRRIADGHDSGRTT